MSIKGQMTPQNAKSLKAHHDEFIEDLIKMNNDIVFRKSASYQKLCKAGKLINLYAGMLEILRNDFQHTLDNVGWNDTNIAIWEATDPQLYEEEI